MSNKKSKFKGIVAFRIRKMRHIFYESLVEKQIIQNLSWATVDRIGVAFQRLERNRNRVLQKIFADAKFRTTRPIVNEFSTD
jgi:hypothetical protein